MNAQFAPVHLVALVFVSGVLATCSMSQEHGTVSRRISDPVKASDQWPEHPVAIHFYSAAAESLLTQSGIARERLEDIVFRELRSVGSQPDPTMPVILDEEEGFFVLYFLSPLRVELVPGGGGYWLRLKIDPQAGDVVGRSTSP